MSKSSNNSSRNGWNPDVICNHVCEGGFSGSVSWLCNTASQASCHTVIGKNGEREQIVDYDRMAWCNGTSTATGSSLHYSKATNRLVKERKTNANYFTYSIEHEGYSYKDLCGGLTEIQYQATLAEHKRMIEDSEARRGQAFLIDREHIIGHFEVTPSSKPNCPAPGGNNFPFDRLIQDLKAWKGEGTITIPSQSAEPTTQIKKSYSAGPYKLGSKGANVQAIQHELQAQGYDCGWAGEDGNFGGDTKNAVLRFQKYHGLAQDGIVGPATWNKLFN